MSKRTSTSRSSPPSPPRFYKKQKTMEAPTASSSPPTNAMILDSVSASPDSGTLHSRMATKNVQDSVKGNTSSSRVRDRSGSPKAKAKPATPGDSSANGWTKVEKKKEKRAKKGALKISNQPPTFAFNVQELVRLGTISISVRWIIIRLEHS